MSARAAALAAVCCACASTRNAGPASEPAPIGPTAAELASLDATADQPRRARIAAAADAAAPSMAKAFADLKAPGLAVGIVVDGELAWFRAFGVREVPSKAPIDEDTAFRIASMSKAFVSAAVVKLRDEGKLQLDDPAEKYVHELSALKYPTTDSPRVTVRHLLSHSAGFPEDNASADLRMPMSEADFDAVLARGLSFSTAPGTGFEYANLGFALAGRVITNVSGQPFQSYISSQILAPLGMGATGWDAAKVPDTHRARGYGRRNSAMPSSGLTKYDDDEPHEEPTLADGAWAAIGGLWTTPRDYAKWVAFQLAASPPRDGDEQGPVRRASLRETQSMQRYIGFSAARPEGRLRVRAAGYALGWGVGQNCSADVVSHTGGLPGFGSYVLLFPAQGIGLFTMTNLTYTSGAGALEGLLKSLDERGLLRVPATPASPALKAARDGVLQLYQGFDDARLFGLVDRTFLVYRSPERVRAQLEKLRAQLGECQAGEPFTAENALRGTARLACARGAIDATLELTSESPPRLQTMDLEPLAPAAGPMLQLASRAAALVADWSDDEARALLGPGVPARSLEGRSRRMRAALGACKLERAWQAAKPGEALVDLACARGQVQLSLRSDEARVQLTSLALRDGQPDRCRE